MKKHSWPFMGKKKRRNAQMASKTKIIIPLVVSNFSFSLNCDRLITGSFIIVEIQIKVEKKMRERRKAADWGREGAQEVRLILLSQKRMDSQKEKKNGVTGGCLRRKFRAITYGNSGSRLDSKRSLGGKKIYIFSIITETDLPH